jgi:hypothetical protein
LPPRSTSLCSPLQSRYRKFSVDTKRNISLDLSLNGKDKTFCFVSGSHGGFYGNTRSSGKNRSTFLLLQFGGCPRHRHHRKLRTQQLYCLPNHCLSLLAPLFRLSGVMSHCSSLRPLSNLRCCDVAITDGADLRSTWLRWAQVFHRDWFRNSGFLRRMEGHAAA